MGVVLCVCAHKCTGRLADFFFFFFTNLKDELDKVVCIIQLILCRKITDTHDTIHYIHTHTYLPYIYMYYMIVQGLSLMLMGL